jgi:hypothetical protein
MRRGTTPTITVTVDADISDMTIYLTFKSGCTEIVKSDDDLTVTTETAQSGDVSTIIETTLTQEDTLAFKSGKDCEVQIRAVKQDGEVAVATTIGTIPVKRILQEGVLDG